MRRIKKILQVADAPSLVISQLKITSSNGQFITLYNSTDTALGMSKYQPEYFNNYDPDKATSGRLISLTGIVPPHGYFMVNDSASVANTASIHPRMLALVAALALLYGAYEYRADLKNRIYQLKGYFGACRADWA